MKDKNTCLTEQKTAYNRLDNSLQITIHHLEN